MTTRLTRRRFGQLSAGTLGYLFTGPAASVLKARGANDKLRVAGIGVGGKGGGDIDQARRRTLSADRTEFRPDLGGAANAPEFR